MSMRLAFALACVVLLSAFAWPTEVPRVRQDDTLTYAFTDARPKRQLKSGAESLLISNCKYGSHRLGDEEFTPGLSVLLNDALMTRLSGELSGKAVTLRNFTVHLNDAAGLKGLNASMWRLSPLNSAANAIFTSKGVACSPDDLFGGYDPKEVGLEVPEAGVAVWVLVIELEVDGKPFRARHAFRYTVDNNRPEGVSLRQHLRRLREADLRPGLQTVFGMLTDQIAAAHAPPVPVGDAAAPVPDPSAAPAEAPAEVPAEVPAEFPADAPAAEAPPSP